MRTLCCCLVTLVWMLIASPALAQFGRQEQANGARVDQQLTQRYQVGVVIKSFGGPCKGLVGTVPVPTEWPEQQVRIVDEDISEFVRRITYRNLGGVREMVFSIPQLPPGEVHTTAYVSWRVGHAAVNIDQCLQPSSGTLRVSARQRDRLEIGTLDRTQRITGAHSSGQELQAALESINLDFLQ